ncbi:hypothetical protein [Neptunicoccus sediminis]|uniref:hypothetical protein n=1 Tax=Neptunicoccus sediminis TaxID=1892596 RepID=UPI0008461523|nr:hypothetical protein [Neptunicoccus sediminis]
MKRQIAIGLAGLCLMLGVGGYMLAGVSVTSQAPAAGTAQDTAQSPFLVERKSGAAVFADPDVMPDEMAQQDGTAPAGPKNLLGALLSGGAKMAKSPDYEPGESRFKKVGTFAGACSLGSGAKRCSTSD